jgi:hypothetical protein
MKRIFTSILFLFATLFATAQTSTSTANASTSSKTAQKTIPAESRFAEKMIADFVEAINEVSKQGNTTRVMSFFAPNFRNEVTIFDLSNKMQVNTRDFFATQDIYARYQQPNNTVNYRISRFLKSYSNDTMAYAVFELDYSLMNKGVVYRKGEQTVTYTLARRQNTWQFVRGTTFIHYTAVEKGVCPCKLFNNGNEYLAQLETPQGEDYTTKQYTFKINILSKTQSEIDADGLIYILNREGHSTITTPDKRSLPMRTNKDAEAINIILNDQHKENCFSVLFK